MNPASPPPRPVQTEQERFIELRQKELRGIGEQTGRSTQSILLLYMHEKLLFRLSQTKYRSNLILKGGLLIYNDTRFKGRPTKDIDFLAQHLPPDSNAMESIFREICLIPVEDGILFDLTKLRSGRLKEDDRSILRITIPGSLGGMKAWVKIDLSFQGVVYPAPVDIEFPVLLGGHSHPLLKAYSIESAIAEKFQVMIVYAQLDSRMKDFYDIYTFANGHSFEGQVLLTAIQETFRQRKTSIEETHVIFSSEFAQDPKRITQWDSFLKKEGIKSITFVSIMRNITVFLKPIYDCLYHGTEFHSRWNHKSFLWE